MSKIERIIRYNNISIILLEDLHTGTGTGSGLIDSLQIRDRKGFPVIRATHMQGLLRDAGKSIEQYEERYTGLTNALFGTIGKKSDRTLRMTSFYSRNPDSLVWSSTARKLQERSPMFDTLRSCEFVPAETVFNGTVELMIFEDTKPEIEEFFELCMKRVDCIGSGRTRGNGLVRICFDPAEKNIINLSQQCTFSIAKNRLRLLLKNLDPVCFPLTGNQGNIISSECYIRGQVLWGALAGLGISLGAGADILFEHHASVSNAYPLPQGLRSTPENISQWEVKPIPLHIQTPKPPGGGADGWPWWAGSGSGTKILGSSREKSGFSVSESVVKLKRPKDNEFIFREVKSSPWQRYAVPLSVHLRNQSTESGAPELFSEEEIPENTLFLAEIEFDSVEAAQQFNKDYNSFLCGDVWLPCGRGGRPVQAVKAEWLDKVCANCMKIEGSQSFDLLLESDAIIRSGNLNFYTALTPENLLEAFRIEEIMDITIDEKDRYIDNVIVRGFNATSGLPTAPKIALRRGSIVRISGNDALRLRNLLVDRLNSSRLVNRWLGEKTNEGFGRFSLDFSFQTEEKPIVPPTISNVSLLESQMKQALELAEKFQESDGEKLSTSKWYYLLELFKCEEKKGILQQINELIDNKEQKQCNKPWNSPQVKEVKKIIESSKDIDEIRDIINTGIRIYLAWLKDNTGGGREHE